jgi:periplasmic protein CpxP/Spy
MRVVVAFALTLLLTGAATAQTGQSTGNPAVKDPQPSSQQSDQAKAQAANTKLESGANSFTEAQARSRLEEAGYQKLADLKKDDNGIWRAKAEKDGRQVTVGLDYKGNVATE